MVQPWPGHGPAMVQPWSSPCIWQAVDIKHHVVVWKSRMLWACSSSLKTRAACSIQNEKSIYAIIRIGTSLDLDKATVKDHPALMAKLPSERGDFERFVIYQIETWMSLKENF